MCDVAQRADHDLDAQRGEPRSETAGEHREGVGDGSEQRPGGEIEYVDLVEPRLADHGERSHQGHR